MLDHRNLVAISFQWGELISQKLNADSGLLDNKKGWTSLAKRPRRSAVLLLCTSSWSIPRSPVAQNLRKTSILKPRGCQCFVAPTCRAARLPRRFRLCQNPLSDGALNSLRYRRYADPHAERLPSFQRSDF